MQQWPGTIMVRTRQTLQSTVRTFVDSALSSRCRLTIYMEPPSLYESWGVPPPFKHGSGCIVHRLDINPRTYTQTLGVMLSRCMSNQASVEENPQQRVTPDYPWQWCCCCAWASICRCRDCSSTAGASNTLKICCTSASIIYNCSAPMQHIDGI